jgi:hypothetical protein
MVSLVTRSVPVLGRHSPFFGPPIFSALRSASRAPIPPAASAVTLQHSRSSVRCSIRRAGQRRLEKAADALKVSRQAGPSFGQVPFRKEAAGRARHLNVELDQTRQRRSWSGRRYPARYPVGHNKLKLLAQLDYKQAAPGTGGARPLPPGIKDSKCCSGKNRRDHAVQVRGSFHFCF